MSPSLTQGLALIAALACSNVAAYSSLEFVPSVPTPSAGAGVEQSIVTITSSYDSTYTIVRATPTTSVETVTTCTAGTMSPVGVCQNTVYSTSGRYYSEQCDNAAVTGAVRINGPGVKDINACLSYCVHFSAYCDMAVYNPTSTYCYLAQASPTAFAAAISTWSSGVQVASVYNTDPCVATVTSTGTEYSTETITTQIVTVFESPITGSATSFTSSLSPSVEPSPEVSSSTTPTAACSATPAAAVQESVVTLTSTYASTYSSIFTTTSASLQTVTTCTPSPFTAGQCQNGVYTLGTKYYDQRCNGRSLTGGATVLVLPAAQIAYCNQYCSVYSTLCSGYNYNTAARVCTFLSGSSMSFASAVAYQAALAYTTNVCVATVTATETQYSTQILSSDVTSVYESTVTLSVSAASCTPTAAPETTSSPVITLSSPILNISSSILPSNSSNPTTSMTTNSTAAPSMITSVPLLNLTSTTVLVSTTNSSVTGSAHFNTSVPVVNGSSMPTSSVATNSSTSIRSVSTNSSISISSFFANNPVTLPLSTTTSLTQLNTSVPAVTSLTSLTSVAPSSVLASSVAAPYANTSSSVPINIAVPTLTSSSFILSPTIMPSIPASSIVVSAAQPEVSSVKTTTPAVTSSGVSASSASESLSAVSVSSVALSTSLNAGSLSSSAVSASFSTLRAISGESPMSIPSTHSLSVSSSFELTAPTSDSTLTILGSPTTHLSTSTVFTTRIATVIACAPEIINCPAKLQSTFLTTETLVLYTTICPVIEIPQPTTTSGNSEAQYTTSTVLSTRTSTITACPSSVSNCPASLQQTFFVTERVVVSTTVCPISAIKTTSMLSPQAIVHIASSELETSSMPQATGAVVSSSVQSTDETYSSQSSAASGSSQVTVVSSTQTLNIPFTLTIGSESTVSASSMTLAALEMISGSGPSVTTSVVLSSVSSADSEKYHSSTDTSSVEGTFSTSSKPYQSDSTGGQGVFTSVPFSAEVSQRSSVTEQGFYSETVSTGVSQFSSTATQALSSATFATGGSSLNTASLSVGASQTSSTTSSYKLVLYTGAASSLQWSLSLILGFVFGSALILSL